MKAYVNVNVNVNVKVKVTVKVCADGDPSGAQKRFRPLLSVICGILLCLPAAVRAESANSRHAAPADHDYLPPFIVQKSPLPNVLIILDNSNSMDETPGGEPVGSADPRGRSEIARQALRRIITDHGASMRLGLMAFRQGGDLQPAHLHEMLVFASYDPGTYDPAAAAAPFDPGVNTCRAPNPSYPPAQPPHGDDDPFIYYDTAVSAYLPAPFTHLFCYATNFRHRAVAPTPADSAGCSPHWHDAHLCSDAPYRCHPAKTGENDITPDGNYTEAGDQPAIDEHLGQGGGHTFLLADGSLSAGYHQLGAQVMLRSVSEAWVSGTSPGGGELIVELADPDAGHQAELLARIAPVTQYAAPYDMSRSRSPVLPVRNAGLTPLYSTLMSAGRYFAGELTDPAGTRYPSPIGHACQKNIVILVTDGLSTEDPFADGNPAGAVAEAASALRRTGVTIDGVDHRFDIQTFVLGFGPPPAAADALDAVAVAGGTDVDGKACRINAAAELDTALGRLLRVISNRTLSAPAAPVVSDARTGEGAVYQAVFYPRLTDGSRSVHWAGDVRALFVDVAGYMHESTPEADGSGDQALQEPTSDEPGGDPFITLCHDETLKTTRVHKARQRSQIPTADQIRDCDPAVFSDTLEDVAWLWSGGEWLAALDDPVIQRVYEQAAGQRYIITGIDTARGDGLVGAEEERPFLASSFDRDTVGLLQAGDEETAHGIVAYIRGADQPGMRPRRIDHDGDGVVETWRLGDIVYGTPVVVGAPAENLDLLYRDASYGDFVRRYRDRRQVVVAGANDGMLHAFNGGIYDAERRAFSRGTPAHELGAELWAYVPYHLLPHLRYLSDPSYGRDGSHICFVDLPPVAFDARIFHDGGPPGQPGAEHPHGWGTLLAGGMRFGGRETRVAADPAGSPPNDLRSLRSSYFILDVTDPEKAPKLLLEFTHPDLGYTTSRPTPLRVGDGWYLMLGSGPYPADAQTLEDAGSSQAGRLFLVDLRRMALAEDFGEGGVLRLGTPRSFVSDLAAVDFDIGDGADSADAVYFGTVAGSRAEGWSGNLQRVRTTAAGEPPVPAPPGEWRARVLLETGRPMAGGVNVGLDPPGNRWVFAGSGRYFTAADGEDVTGQHFFGVREPCSVSDGGERAFTWGETDLSGLRDVTPVVMRSDDPAAQAMFETLRDEIGAKHGGWYLELGEEGERAVGRATLLGDLLNFTTFTPNQDLCADGGTGNLYAVHFATGTAGWEPAVGVAGDDPGDPQADGAEIPRRIPLGQGLCSLPSLHVGKQKGVKVYLQSSNGAITVVDERPGGVLRGGPVHWELW